MLSKDIWCGRQEILPSMPTSQNELSMCTKYVHVFLTLESIHWFDLLLSKQRWQLGKIVKMDALPLCTLTGDPLCSLPRRTTIACVRAVDVLSIALLKCTNIVSEVLQTQYSQCIAGFSVGITTTGSDIIFQSLITFHKLYHPKFNRLVWKITVLKGSASFSPCVSCMRTCVQRASPWIFTDTK